MRDRMDTAAFVEQEDIGGVGAVGTASASADLCTCARYIGRAVHRRKATAGRAKVGGLSLIQARGNPLNRAVVGIGAKVVLHGPGGCCGLGGHACRPHVCAVDHPLPRCDDGLGHVVAG